MIQCESKGIISKAEVRQWMNPDETFEDAEKKIKEIEKSKPDIKQLLGTNNEE